MNRMGNCCRVWSLWSPIESGASIPFLGDNRAADAAPLPVSTGAAPGAASHRRRPLYLNSGSPGVAAALARFATAPRSRGARDRGRE